MRVDRESVVAHALDLIWLRCCGKAPPAANRVGRVIDENAKKFFTLGEAALKREFRPGIEASLDKLPESIRRFSAEIRPELTRIKIICFSELKACNLMWSHYAESHAGLVIEFQCADGCDSVYRLAKPVIYSERPPQFSDDSTVARILAGDKKFSSDDVD